MRRNEKNIGRRPRENKFSTSSVIGSNRRLRARWAASRDSPKNWKDLSWRAASPSSRPENAIFRPGRRKDPNRILELVRVLPSLGTAPWRQVCRRGRCLSGDWIGSSGFGRIRGCTTDRGDTREGAGVGSGYGLPTSEMQMIFTQNL